MSVLAFRMRNVPEEEAAEVRSLLDEHEIEWYETTAGNWSIAMPGLWLTHEADLPRARELINHYQQKRASTQRQQYEQALHTGDAPTLKRRVQLQPLQTAGIVIFCLFILYVSINPFLQLIGYS